MSEYKSLVTGLTYAGPDQGIDFTGKGAIHAPVDLHITRIAEPGTHDQTSWPGGHVIVGEVLNLKWARMYGHGYGHFIYFAEALKPKAGLKVGDIVRKGHELATLNSSYPGCEIGWAQDAHGMPFGSPHDGKSGGPTPRHGLAFRDFILHQSEHW